MELSTVDPSNYKQKIFALVAHHGFTFQSEHLGGYLFHVRVVWPWRFRSMIPTPDWEAYYW